jgi:hypothetical protein
MGMQTNAGASAVGAALGVILVYLIEVLTGTDIPLAVEGAITVVVTFVVGYIVPPQIGGGGGSE